jgi:hypothetical protein
MKKGIPKPENWQDFESLCKKLWGEIWGISNKIKKNGRLGQNQAGVDVYGKPKGKANYWGIQCKGKDDYSSAQLTKTEIDKEIEKAKLFKPQLEVYIIATTANKDAIIEEYVRLKDIENQKDSFEVLLYCWEDIADLIEENRDTFNWYINEIKHRSKHSFEVSLFSENGENYLQPKYEKIITKKKLIDLPTSEEIEKRIKAIRNIGNIHEKIKSLPINQFYSKVNHSWVELEIEMSNTGSAVIEDWKVNFKFEDGISRISDRSSHNMFMTIPDLSPMSRVAIIEPEDMAVYYRPHENKALIQKDFKSFQVPILINPDSEQIKVSWELLARDYSISGSETIGVKPLYEEKIEFDEVYDESDLTEDDIRISYLVKDK